jgi:uncharacterized membrane protein YeaQ/YmgE (transglycosylase-associated protein family)
MFGFSLISLIYFLIIGAIAGYLAGRVMTGKDFGLGMNIVIGIIGAMLGGFLFGLLGFVAYGLIAQLITAFVGAIVLLWIVSMIRK